MDQELNKDLLKKILLQKFRKYIRKSVLKKHIDDLVDDYIEKYNFTKLYTIDSLPKSYDIKWWFQEKPDAEFVEYNGKEEKNYEIQMNNIYMSDELARYIFKFYHDWYWCPGCEIPDKINALIDIYKKFKYARKNKPFYESRLANISLIGSIRFYNLEWKPYLCNSEIKKCFNHLRDSLKYLDRIRDGKMKEKHIKSKIYIFDPFNLKEDGCSVN
jgi:hypothetical protein